MNRLYVRLNEDKTPSHASLSGIEQPDGKVVYWHKNKYEANEEVIIIKVKGFGFWSGRGQPQSYAPAEYQIYKVNKREDNGLIITLQTERLAEFPVRN